MVVLVKVAWISGRNIFDFHSRVKQLLRTIGVWHDWTSHIVCYLVIWHGLIQNVTLGDPHSGEKLFKCQSRGQSSDYLRRPTWERCCQSANRVGKASSTWGDTHRRPPQMTLHKGLSRNDVIFGLLNKLAPPPPPPRSPFVIFWLTPPSPKKMTSFLDGP